MRVWGSALTKAKLTNYGNSSIKDVQAAINDDKLMLYYDFNQSGGNVIDRSGSDFTAQRVGFGPDGDAWNSALGVFTLDPSALMHGDISSKYLSNYKNPFVTASGTVNPNDSKRFLPLEMGNSRSKWKHANAIVSGSITTGAHIDTAHKNDITFETQWSGFATPLLNYHLWQIIKLPAGKYTFSVTFGDGSDAQTSRLVVCAGKSMINDSECEEQAIAWSSLVGGVLEFSLYEETQVSLGLIVNLTGQASFCISSFKLEGYTYETLTPVSAPTGITNVTPAEPAVRGIYNISGQRLNELQKGVNIVDGKKVFNK